MIPRTVSARYDGEKVLFDEDVIIPADARLLVTILEDADKDRAEFHQLAAASFADAFDGDEVEYSEADFLRK